MDGESRDLTVLTGVAHAGDGGKKGKKPKHTPETVYHPSQPDRRSPSWCLLLKRMLLEQHAFQIASVLQPNINRTSKYYIIALCGYR